MDTPTTVLATYEVADGVMSRVVGDETVIVGLNYETYFGVNRVGSMIWTELEKRTPVPQIVTTIVDRFDVSAERAAADVCALLEALEQSGLVTRRT